MFFIYFVFHSAANFYDQMWESQTVSPCVCVCLCPCWCSCQRMLSVPNIQLSHLTSYISCTLLHCKLKRNKNPNSRCVFGSFLLLLVFFLLLLLLFLWSKIPYTLDWCLRYRYVQCAANYYSSFSIKRGIHSSTNEFDQKWKIKNLSQVWQSNVLPDS